MTASSRPKPLQIIQQTIHRALYSRWNWSTQKTYTTRTMHICWHKSAWWLTKSGYQSISTTSSALGWRRQRLRSWSRTSITRTAMCYTIGICSYTCLWACVWLRSIVPPVRPKPVDGAVDRMNTELRKKAADHGKPAEAG